ncbi:hypothetical protein B4098_1326 [Heyndrickxia coagulans]|uniref:Uncharacterized protein n=1 Tax=Heyndrickxia coagulans TaxID=1398 RepID=A0A150KC31_HEYCO|nr:hypothetical protein B4098_1326 [Heyndrickxia coagulans]
MKIPSSIREKYLLASPFGKCKKYTSKISIYKIHYIIFLSKMKNESFSK